MGQRLFTFALSLVFAISIVSTHVVHADTVRTDTTLLLNQARMWVGHNRDDLARIALDKLFTIAPDNREAMAVLCDIDIRDGKFDAARKELARLRQIIPGSSGVRRLNTLLRLQTTDKIRLIHARLLAKGGKVQQALGAYKALLPDGPPDGDIALEYWQLVARTPGGWRPAEKGLLKLVHDNPYTPRYRLSLAEHQAWHNHLNLKALHTLIAFTKQSVYADEARTAWRHVVLDIRPSTEAATHLRRYLGAVPNDYEVQKRLEYVLRVVAAHQRLIANPAYRIELKAQASMKQGDLDTAQRLLTQALSGLPHRAELLGDMGLVLLRRGQDWAARGYFLAAARYASNGRSEWVSLARTAEYWGLMHEASEARAVHEFSLAVMKERAAIAISPDDAAGIVALAETQAAQGKPDAARRNYLHVLSLESTNSDALEGLVRLDLEAGELKRARRFMSRLTPVQHASLGHNFDTLRAELWSKWADRDLAVGNIGEAVGDLQRAVRATPDDPWLCLHLARLYAGRDQIDQGRKLFDGLLLRAPHDPDALYAFALFESGRNENFRALRTLQRIPSAQRSASMTRYQRRLWVGIQIRRASALASSGLHAKAIHLLERVERAVHNDPERTLDVAAALAEQGDAPRARRLLIPFAERQEPVAWHLRYAKLLYKLGVRDELDAELKHIAALPRSSEENKAFNRLRDAVVVHRTEAELAAGHLEAARRILAPRIADEPGSTMLLLARARIATAANRPLEAGKLYRRILERHPDQAEARRGLVESLAASGNRGEALALIRHWFALAPLRTTATSVSGPISAQPVKVWSRLIQMQIYLGQYRQAGRRLDRLLAVAPDNPDVLNLAANLARRDEAPDRAIKFRQRALSFTDDGAVNGPRLRLVAATADHPSELHVDGPPATMMPALSNRYRYRQLARMLDKRTNWFSSAFDWQMRSGTPGSSQLDLFEVPLEWRSPRARGGQYFLRADLVKADAGTVNLNDAYQADRFGSLKLRPPGFQSNMLAQSAQGVSLTAGYDGDDLHIDVGTTAFGFDVTNIVGGIEKKGDIGPLSYSLDVSRRPMTNSLLSYAGTRDPRTGRIWGGLVATGVRIGLSHDHGGSLGLWSTLGTHLITGRNVQNNSRIRLMAGGYLRIINEQDRKFTVGLTGMLWHYSRDAGEYTFGHGGYYSPQLYSSLSLPISFSQRFPRFSYELRASVSISYSRTAAAPFFPTDAAMQVQAGNPYYGASSGPGHGYSFLAACEYQATPRLFLGARFDLERSQYYAPNELLLYMRMSIGHTAARPVSLPPEPVFPSSQF